MSLAGVLFLACGSDKTGDGRVSQRGESCQSSGDCEPGLVCVRNTCSVGSYSLTPTGKQCVLSSCHEPIDCCPTPPPSCPFLLQQCEGGITFDCQTYQTQCLCDGSRFTCESGKCAQACMPATAVTSDTCKLLGAGFSCVGGRCVECTQDAECPMVTNVARVCRENKCQIKCTKETDCDPFYDCDTATSTCFYVGCQTNLECIAKTGNPLAVCNATKCDVPCQSDPECLATISINPNTGVMGGLQVCIDAHCVDVGCDSDDQCRILNHILGGSKTTAECREVPAP